MTLIGGGMMAGGTAGALVLAGFDAPAIALGGAFLLAVTVRVFRRRKPRKLRPWPCPRRRPLEGWRLTGAVAAAAALWGVAFTAACAGSVSWTVILGGLAAVLAGRCAAAGRDRRQGPPAEPAWSEQDQAILLGDLSLAAWERTGQARGGEQR